MDFLTKDAGGVQKALMNSRNHKNSFIRTKQDIKFAKQPK